MNRRGSEQERQRERVTCEHVRTLHVEITQGANVEAQLFKEVVSQLACSYF